MENYAAALLSHGIPDRKQHGQNKMLHNLGTTYGDLGNVYFVAEQYGQAIEYYSRALAISRDLKDNKLECEYLRHLGDAYHGHGQFDKANECFAMARSINCIIGIDEPQDEGTALVAATQDKRYSSLWACDISTVTEAIYKCKQHAEKKAQEEESKSGKRGDWRIETWLKSTGLIALVAEVLTPSGLPSNSELHFMRELARLPDGAARDVILELLRGHGLLDKIVDEVLKFAGELCQEKVAHHAPTAIFQGHRVALPIDDPKQYYTQLDFVWDLLDSSTVVLVKGSWLLHAGRKTPYERIPCRQELPPEAIVDPGALRDAINAWAKCGLSWFNLIVAISHCWLSHEHPDPEGKLLGELAPAIESYLNFIKRYGLFDFDGAFFFAWCSIHQVGHANVTDEELLKFRRALENIDIWYLNSKTQVWMLTRTLSNERPYHARGWPSWEYAMAEMISHSYALLDLGEMELSGRRDISYDEIRKYCLASRRAPLLPEDFARLLKQKLFTKGNIDCDIVTENYCRNFSESLQCVTEYSYYNMQWGDREAIRLARVLPQCCNLHTLRIRNTKVGDAGAFALAQGLMQRRELRVLDLSDNLIGDTGVCELVTPLMHCSQIVELRLACNQIGDEGASALADVTQCCVKLEVLDLENNNIHERGLEKLTMMYLCDSALQELKLGRNPVGNAGAMAIADVAIKLPSLTLLNLAECQIHDEGVVALASILPRSKLLELRLERNQIRDDGASALAEGMIRAVSEGFNERPSLRPGVLASSYEGSWSHPVFHNIDNHITIELENEDMGRWFTYGEWASFTVRREGKWVSFDDNDGLTQFQGLVNEAGAIIGNVVQSGDQAGFLQLMPPDSLRIYLADNHFGERGQGALRNAWEQCERKVSIDIL